MRREVATILGTLSTLTTVLIVVLHVEILSTTRKEPPVFLDTLGHGSLDEEKPPPPPSPQKYLIYLCDRQASCGGWGDRQRGFVSAFLLANLTGRRFGINMSVPCHLTNYYLPNLVNWIVTEEEIRGKSVRYIYSINNGNAGSFNANLSFVDFNQVYQEDVIFLRTNLEHYWTLKANKHYKTGANPWIFHGRPRFFDDSWKWLMTPGILLRGMTSDLLNKWGFFNRTKPFVCAHMRIGHTKDQLQDSKVFNDINSLGPMWTFLETYVKAGSHIFLATDNANVRQMSKDKYGSFHHDTGGVIEHVDRKRAGTDEGCEGFLYALLDQMILTMCDILLICNSNFSYRAALIRATTDGLYWFRQGNVNPVTSL